MSNTSDYIDPRQIGPVPQAVAQPGYGPPIDPTQQQSPPLQQPDVDKVVHHAREPSVAEPQMIAPQRPAAPKYQDIPAAPNVKYHDVFKEAAPALMLVTALGSAAMRSHGMGAMEAATGFINGFQKTDKEKMDAEQQKWKDSVDAIVKQNQVETDRYNAALKITDAASRHAALLQISSSLNDPLIKEAVAAGDDDLAAGLVQSRVKSTEQLQLAQFKAGVVEQKQLSDPKFLASPQGQAFISRLPPEEQAK